jgi:hypothetical protein
MDVTVDCRECTTNCNFSCNGYVHQLEREGRLGNGGPNFDGPLGYDGLEY